MMMMVMMKVPPQVVSFLIVDKIHTCVADECTGGRCGVREAEGVSKSLDILLTEEGMPATWSPGT